VTWVAGATEVRSRLHRQFSDITRLGCLGVLERNIAGTKSRVPHCNDSRPRSQIICPHQ
jgi:hypothetical protein